VPPGFGILASIDASDLGSPVESLRDIPAGDYYAQAMVNVYSEFKRADGHAVWMHDDRWEAAMDHLRLHPGALLAERAELHPLDEPLRLPRSVWHPTVAGLLRLRLRRPARLHGTVVDDAPAVGTRGI
jgi:hypothetical protein